MSVVACGPCRDDGSSYDEQAKYSPEFVHAEAERKCGREGDGRSSHDDFNWLS